MKVILSRKGFDSANGGIMSPILEDGTMISLPIPAKKNKNGKAPCNLEKDRYNELAFYDRSRGERVSYEKIMKDLGYDFGRNPIYCHFDPDLDNGRRIKKIDGWLPAFGQIGSSASYLEKAGIGECGNSDLFLFFGNFHFVEYKDGKYRYTKDTGDFYKDNDLQVIWGYLQIDDRKTGASEILERVPWHPHAMPHRTGEKYNVIFTGRDKLTLDLSKPGVGVLPFHKNRVLTAVGESKATWKNKDIYDEDHHFYIRKKRHNSAKDPKKGLYYAGVWQELVLAESDDCTKWAKEIIML